MAPSLPFGQCFGERFGVAIRLVSFTRDYPKEFQGYPFSGCAVSYTHSKFEQGGGSHLCAANYCGRYRPAARQPQMDRFVCLRQPLSGRGEQTEGGRGMANLVRESGLQRIRIRPSAAGTLSRLACVRAEAAGIDVAPLMAKAGVTRQEVEDDDVWLLVQGQIRFVELIAVAMQDDLLGFHIARDYDLREVGVLHYVLHSSELLGDALRRAERYSRIANEGISLRVREGKELAVTFEYVGVERLSDRHQIEAWVTWLVRGCRQLTGRRLLPSCVRFVHRRKGGCPELDTFMGCAVDFGAATDEVAFPGTVAQMPVVNADRYLNELLIKYCEEARAHREAGRGTFRVGLENAIAPLLPHGKARADEIARRLGMSPRTLARRLAAEGLTFAGVFHELRADLARRYLEDDDLAISQIAWLLGYQEVSAFTHAFKRWTGKTPREARSQENGARPAFASRGSGPV
jgi:AraC-like DNA-binding protein